MKVRFLYFICFLMLLGSCRRDDVMSRIPSNVLTRNQMIPLLVDIHLTEATLKLNQANIKPNETKLYYSNIYSPVFKKNKTTPEQFDRSIQWYSKHIDKLDDIYTEVITRLSKLETQLKARPAKAPVKKITHPDTVVKKITRIAIPAVKKK